MKIDRWRCVLRSWGRLGEGWGDAEKDLGERELRSVWKKWRFRKHEKVEREGRNKGRKRKICVSRESNPDLMLGRREC